MTTPRGMTPNPPLNLGGAMDVARPQPTDPPGARDAAGWVKTDADIDGVSAGGWRSIDDVGDDGTPEWRES